MGTLWQDVKYGFRTLRKGKGLTAVAVVTLALGIGANTAIFSVVNTVLLKALPYDDPDRIVMLWGTEVANENRRGQSSATDTHDWRAQSTAFEDVASFMSWRPILSATGGPERVRAAQVSDGFFRVMHGRVVLGRVFRPEEQEDGEDRVVVISHGLWQRRFGGDPEIIGKTVRLNLVPYEIVGVLGPEFVSLPRTILAEPAELYRPVAEPYDLSQRDARHLRAIARLKPGVTREQAQSEMDVIAARIAQQYPRENAGYGVNVVPLQEDLVTDLKRVLLLLLGAVGFVLLIACANVGNLLLARAAARQREIAVRSALGAGRGRLMRLFLTESLLLAGVGGVLGLLLALWGTSLLEEVGSKVHPLLAGIHLSAEVMVFTLGISLLAGIVFGLAPALQAARPDLSETLKEGGRGTTETRSRLRSALVVSEVGLALVLLTGAGLMIQSVARLQRVDPGFDAAHLLKMDAWLPYAKYREAPAQISFFRELMQRLEALPGVKSAGAVSTLPFADFDRVGLYVEGREYPPNQNPSPDRYVVTPGYFRTMSIALVRGRLLDDRDTENAPLAALVSEKLAREVWPGEDALGKRIHLPGLPGQTPPWRTVVGVVRDIRQYGFDHPVTPQLYLPHAQYAWGSMTLVVRAEGEPTALAAPVRSEILRLDPELPIFDVATIEEVVGDSIALRRFSMALLGLFAAIALILAAVGIYGVISYGVAQRTREIGVRIALGAQRRDVLRLILNQGMALTIAGVALGAAASIGLNRFLANLLFEVEPTDGTTYGVVCVVLVMVALLACVIPARRAMRVEPVEALRHE